MNRLTRLLDLFRPIVPVIQQPGKPGSYPVNTRLRKKR